MYDILLLEVAFKQSESKHRDSRLVNLGSSNMFEIGSLDSRILVYATYNVIFLFTLAEVLEKRLSRGVQEGKRGYWHCLTE